MEIPLPDPAARRRLFELYGRGLVLRVDGLDRLVARTEGVSPAQTPLGADGTQFNGGFLVDGPRCATLEVSTPRWRAPRRATVSFGAGRCRS